MGPLSWNLKWRHYTVQMDRYCQTRHKSHCHSYIYVVVWTTHANIQKWSEMGLVGLMIFQHLIHTKWSSRPSWFGYIYERFTLSELNVEKSHICVVVWTSQTSYMGLVVNISLVIFQHFIQTKLNGLDQRQHSFESSPIPPTRYVKTVATVYCITVYYSVKRYVNTDTIPTRIASGNLPQYPHNMSMLWQLYLKHCQGQHI